MGLNREEAGRGGGDLLAAKHSKVAENVSNTYEMKNCFLSGFLSLRHSRMKKRGPIFALERIYEHILMTFITKENMFRVCGRETRAGPKSLFSQ